MDRGVSQPQVMLPLRMYGPTCEQIACDLQTTEVSLPLKRDAEAATWDLDHLQRFLARALCFPKYIQNLSLSVDGRPTASFSRRQQADAAILHPSPCE